MSEIPGWYDYADFWQTAIDSAPRGACLVEIGVFAGKSIVDLARRAKAADKDLRVIGVDTFAGSAEHQEELSKQPPGALMSAAWNNTRQVGSDCYLLVSDSVQASRLFANETVWAAFIDADHSTEAVTRDIDAWLPRIAPGGLLGGHDYHSWPSVREAVNAKWPEIAVPANRSWWAVKSAGDTSKKALLVAVLAYADNVQTAVAQYMADIRQQLAGHPAVGHIAIAVFNGYPTDRVRNLALKTAVEKGFGYLLMIDDDMVPDIDDGPKFLPTALEFMHRHNGPCVVAAPYCGAPPLQEVLVMHDRILCPDNADLGGTKLDKYTRDEAALQKGITRVAALPTGMMLIDTRIASQGLLAPPWFSYEWEDVEHTKLASTEDIVFSRNCHWLKIPQYCAWDSWAGHRKRYTTGKPRTAPIERVPDSIWTMLRNGHFKPKTTEKQDGP